jgi:hypothetical protein
MRANDRFVASLFALPGARGVSHVRFLARAAAAHLSLLRRAVRDAKAPSAELLEPISSLVERLPARQLREEFLLDPVFIEGLHAAADESRALANWHRAIAEPSVADVCATTACRAPRLGNTLLALLLRHDPGWCGRIVVQSDLYGRLRFPLCDWSFLLSSNRLDPWSVCAEENVVTTLTRNEVRFALENGTEQPLVHMPRHDWLRMLVDNDDSIDGRGMQFFPGEIAVRLHFANPIPGWRIRYEPLALLDFERHAGLTGGLVAAVLDGLRHHAPPIAAEFDAVMSVVRGWELPATPQGTLQSFSDPTLPRVMGVNVLYSPSDEPLVCPFCLTWFGHELGHTKSYLIETILHAAGGSLTTNGNQMTDPIARYGRALAHRTLLQIPYTHLYEWALLISALEGKFAALPWPVSADPIAFGEDLRLEIEEAFERIAEETDLTSCGRAVIGRLQSLFATVSCRWWRLTRQSSTATPR